MVVFTYAEKADMHYMYGCTNSNDRAALRLYHAQFRDRRMPGHRIFQRLHRQLSEAVTYLEMSFFNRVILMLICIA